MLYNFILGGEPTKQAAFVQILVNCVHTVELQWLEHLWDHENMFGTKVVRADECLSLRQVRRHNRDIFSIFSDMKVCFVFSLESPHRGDSNENT